MRIPTRPPESNIEALEKRFDAGEVLRLLLSEAKPIDAKGRYLSWDEFRRRPLPDGLDAERAWLQVRYARRSRAIETGFYQASGAPFTLTEIGPLRNNLHQIDQTAGGTLTSLSPVTASVAQADRHLVTSLVEEPYSSAAFEGAVTTRERAKEMIEQGSDPRSRDDLMVLNNYRAMRFVKEQLDAPLTPQVIFDIHRIVTEGTLDKPDGAGRLRRADEDIGVWDETTGERVHEPPPAGQLDERLGRLCAFANEDYRQADPFLNPVTRAIMLHFMIGYDHPFIDGNGRTARALFYWYVLKHGYWLLEYVSISKIIREETGRRYEKAYLDTETDEGDVTYFVLQQLGVVLRALDALKAYLAQKAAEQDEVGAAIRELGRSGGVNHRQAALLADAARNPNKAFTIAEHQRVNGVVYLTARKDLERLHEDGWLSRDKRGRQIEYRAAPELSDLLKAR